MYSIFLMILFITLATKMIAIPIMKKVREDDTEWKLFVYKWGLPENAYIYDIHMQFWLISKQVKILRRENPEFEAELQVWLERRKVMGKRSVPRVFILFGIMVILIIIGDVFFINS